MTLPPNIQGAVNELAARAAEYERYQQWYDGVYDARDLIRGLPIRDSLKTPLCALAENLCPLVVDTLADRLKLNGVEADTYGDEAAQILQRARIDAFQAKVHRKTGTQGDGYVLVWKYDAEPVRLYFHEAREMAVVRDPERPERLLAAVKIWTERVGKSDRLRLTVFYPDRVERYVRSRQASVGGVVNTVRGWFFGANDTVQWEPFNEDGDSVQPNLLGVVPVAVFNNAAWQEEGVSELRDVIPLQRFLNKSLFDYAIGSEANGVPTRYLLNWDFEIDETTGKPKNPFDPRQSPWVLAGENITAGQFQMADLTKMADGTAVYREGIARVSRTPLHYLGDSKGGWPSGEALKTAEAAFTAKVNARQKEFGEPWEDTVRFALMWEVGAPADLFVEAKWADTRPRAEYEYWQGQQIQHDLGKSKREIWTEEGYSDEQITQMLQERDGEAGTQADALGRLFSSGGQVAQ